MTCSVIGVILASCVYIFGGIGVVWGLVLFLLHGGGGGGGGMRGTLTTYPTVDIEDTWSEGWVGEEEHSGAEHYHSKTNNEVEVGATQSDQPGGIEVQ